MNSYGKFGGERRHVPAICKKKTMGRGTYVPPAVRGLKITSMPGRSDKFKQPYSSSSLDKCNVIDPRSQASTNSSMNAEQSFTPEAAMQNDFR